MKEERGDEMEKCERLYLFDTCCELSICAALHHPFRISNYSLAHESVMPLAYKVLIV